MMLTHQCLTLGQDDGLDVVAHELGVPLLQLRHLAAAQQLLAEVLVLQYIQRAGQIVLIKGIVAGAVRLGIDQPALAEKLAPGVVAVTGQEGVIKIEKSQAHAAFLGG